MPRWAFIPVFILMYCLNLSTFLSTAHAIKDLVFLDASFASQITDRHPSRVPHRPVSIRWRIRVCGSGCT